MVITFRGQGISIRETLCILKIILQLLQNEWTQMNYWKFCYKLGLD